MERSMSLIAAQYGVTVAAAALHLIDTPFTFTAAQLAEADVLIIQVEANAIRRRVDGTAPTTTVGLLLNTSQPFYVWRGNQEIQDFECIRDGGSSATVNVELWKWD